MNGLDVDTLTKLTYERSKYWAEVMERFSQQDETEDIALDEFEDLLAPANDSEMDDDEAMNSDEALECEEDDDDENDDMPMDITNYSIIKCDDASNKSLNKYALVDCYGNVERNTKLQDFLNQTLNIFNEHQRQLREAGVDRVLNTFDSKKIEETLGGWLRHNQYAYPVKHRYLPQEQLLKPQLCLRDSDNESLHSIETAQYIRSSRKQHLNSNKKSSTATTMTIKTFRTVKSKRDALREKYACAEHEEHHVEKVRMRRRQHNFDYQHPCNMPNTFNEYQQQQRRRKQLRKRRVAHLSSSTDFDEDTEEDNDYTETTEYAASHCRSHHGCTHRKNHTPKCHTLHCQRGLQISFRSPTRTSYYATQNYKQMTSGRKRRSHDNSSDLYDERPCRQESECQCRNRKMLCQNYRHIVNSSSEEWLVENCLTPLKKKIDEAKMDILNSIKAETISMRKKRGRPKRVLIKEEINSDASLEIIEVTEPKREPNDGKQKKNSLNSKEVALKPCKIKATNAVEVLPFKMDEQEAFKLSQTQNELQKAKKPDDAAGTITLHSSDTLAARERALKPQPKCVKARKLAKQAEEISFLSNASEIYNSTALPHNSTAKSKQFRKAESIKSNSLASNTTQNAGKAKAHTKTATNDEDNDCTVVTSTTGHDTCINVNDKGIVIYKPHDQNNAANSTTHGYFNVTQDHLAAVIGEKSARKFWKYYVGRRRFDCNSTVYYRPPKDSMPTTSSNGILQLAKADSNSLMSETESDDDILDCVNQYGELYESLN